MTHYKERTWRTKLMKTILIILGVIYLIIGFVIYLLTMNKSDALQNSINDHSPVNTFIYTHKWLWLLIICFWPIWLFVSEKLPEE